MTPIPRAARPSTAKAATAKVPVAKKAVKKAGAPARKKAQAIAAIDVIPTETAPKAPRKPKVKAAPADRLLALTVKLLDDGKAEDIATIDLKGKSDIADYMVIATGNSQRQVAALAQRLTEGFKAAGYGKVSVEGLRQGDWVLLDAGDIVVHLFRPETRAHYNLEKMWGEALAEAANQ
jgi:ribosome-associated protein